MAQVVANLAVMLEGPGPVFTDLPIEVFKMFIPYAAYLAQQITNLNFFKCSFFPGSCHEVQKVSPESYIQISITHVQLKIYTLICHTLSYFHTKL